MKIDFASLLDIPVGSAPVPSPVPEGTYKGQIEGVPKLSERHTKAGTKGILTVMVSLQEAGDDVDEAELAECGGLTRDNGDPKRVGKDFWIDSESLYQLDQFIATFGFGPDISLKDALKELPNRSVTVYVVQDTFTAKGGGEVTNNKVKTIYCNE